MKYNVIVNGCYWASYDSYEEAQDVCNEMSDDEHECHVEN